MSWIFLTLTASIIEAIAAIFSRFSVKHESKNTTVIVMLWSYFAGLMFTLPAVLSGSVEFSPIVATAGLLCALCYLVAEHYYYKAIGHSEIGRIVPILSINPIFILLGTTFLFGEIHQIPQYVGMALILFGIMLNSWDQQKHHLIDRRAIYWSIIAAVLFAIKTLSANWLSLLEFNPLNILFWIGIWILIFSLPITFIVMRKNKKLDKRVWANLAFAASLESSATLLFTAAVSIGPAAIIAFLDRLEILFVFVIANFLDFFQPQLLREKFVKDAFFQKLAAVIIVLIGSYFLI